MDSKIKFPAEVAEDVFFNFDAVCATDKIIKIDTPFYIHRVYKNSTTYNPTRINKNIQCLMKLHEHIEEKLLPLNDFEFTQKVLNYWTAHVTGSYILPFVRTQNPEIILEMSKALQDIFGKDSSFVLTLLQLYSQMRVANSQNKKLQAENEKLKTVLKNVQKQIAEVVES